MVYNFLKKTESHIWGDVKVGGSRVQVHVLFDEKGADVEFYPENGAKLYKNKPNQTRSGKSISEVVNAINKYFKTTVLDDIRLVTLADL